MKIKSIISIILTLTIPLNLGAFIVDASINPPIDQIVFQDDFSDGTIDGRYDLFPTSGTITETDGALNITRTSTTGTETIADLYFNEDKTALTGTYGIYYELTRPKPFVGKISARIRGDKSDYVFIDWVNTGAVQLSYATTQGGVATTINLSAVTDAVLKVGIVVDTRTSAYSLWINDVKVVTTAFSRTANLNYITHLRFFMGTTSLTTASIDNFKIHQPILDDTDKVAFDTLGLTETSVFGGTSVMGNVELPKFGNNQSEIIWESSNPELIDNDGNVNQPTDDQYPGTDPQVTLTAKIKSGAIEKTKVFAVKVLKKPDTPFEGSIIYSDNFDDNQVDENYIKLTPTSGTIEEKDGMLNIARTSSDGSETIADIYFDKDKKPQSGIIGLNFELTRKIPAVGNVNVRLRTKSNADYLGIDWHADNTQTIYYSETYGTTGAGTKFPAIAGNKMSVNILIDTNNSFYSMWINGERKVNGVFSRVANSDNVMMLRTYLATTSTSMVSIDNVGLYNTELSNKDKIYFDKSLLNSTSFITVPPMVLGTIDSNLALPTIGVYGSSIRWESSNNSIINENGVVIRPFDSEFESDPTIKLTAYIELNGIIQTKEFSFVVLRKKTPVLEPIIMKDIIFIDDFNGETLNDKWITATTNQDVFLSNHALKLVKTSTDKEVFAKLNISDGKDIDFLTGVKFKITKPTSGYVSVYVKNSENSDFINLRLYSDGKLDVKTSENPSAPREFTTVAVIEQTESLIDILFDPQNSRFSIWLDNNRITNYLQSSKENLIKIANIMFSIDGSEITSTTIDDFVLYKAQFPSGEVLTLDFDSLVDGIVASNGIVHSNVIANDLTLIKVGKYGSDISWVSSNPSIIDTNGKITRPASNESDSEPVTLTATISFEGKTKTKSFTYVVMKEDIAPKVFEPIYMEEFNEPITSSQWVFAKEGGDIYVNDGNLTLDRRVNAGITIADYYIKPDRTAVSGFVAMQFKVQKSENGILPIRIRAQGSNDFFAATWVANGGLQVAYSTDPTQAGNFITIGTYPNTGIEFTILFDTLRSKYTLWVNRELKLKDVYARVAGVKEITYFRMYQESTTIIRTNLDYLRIYEPIPDPDEMVVWDKEWLDENMLFDFVINDFINTNVKLPTKGKYGSDITYQSSNLAVISNDGIVTRPTTGAEDPMVSITATLKSGDAESVKVFHVRVLRDLKDIQDILKADADMLSSIVTKEKINDIKTSLNFLDKGYYGSDISWTSGNTAVIAKSGRVTRPKWNKPSVDVKVIATLKKDGTTLTKEFDFTVSHDEEPLDPKHMSDEEFFGLWSVSTNEWVTSPRLDYTFSPKLAPVETAVKEADYTKAKSELLSYMKNRTNKLELSKLTRDVGWVTMFMDKIYNVQSADYYQGEFEATNYWQEVYIDVKPKYIQPGGLSTYNLNAWYNESSSLEIASKEFTNEKLRPKLEVVINGKVVEYPVLEDATIRAGNFKNKNLGNGEVLTVKTFGDFLGDETYRSLLKFSFSNIKTTDTVSSARLVLYCRATPQFSGKKRILVMKEPTNTWDEKTVNWSDLSGFVYSFNGLVGQNNWEKPYNSDYEYLPQSTRFNPLTTATWEYALTRNEDYAYKILDNMMDFVVDKGGYIHPLSPSARGSYTSSLDTASRLSSFIRSMDVLYRSEYMTAEISTALLKNICDMSNTLIYIGAATGNWVQAENMAQINTVLAFPEFADAYGGLNWYKKSKGVLEELIFANTFEDGSYLESTNGYSRSAFTTFASYKELMDDNGVAVSPEYDDRLKKLAYYIELMYYPNGDALQYGDEQFGKRASGIAKLPIRWYGDRELEYIDTFGQYGTKPNWTSAAFPDSRITIMRSDWDENATYLFTNVRGGGQGHGHADDNHISLAAFGRTLLTDAGIFTYDKTDPYRIWGHSTIGHNTVEINNTSQAIGWGKGTIEDISLNENFDYVKQSTLGTAGFNHQRSITFLKPNIFIVSDYIKPTNLSKANDYKQLWHMMPTANLSIDTTKNIIRSNYSTGANVVIASADSGISTVSDNGWYDLSYQQLSPSKYGYFTKKSVSGITTFDTVLFPSRDNSGNVDVKRLSLNVDTSIATAMEFTITSNDYNGKNYYYLSNEETPSVRVFGKYKTDAKMVLIETTLAGDIINVIMKNGSFIEDVSTGKIVIKSTSVLNSISLMWEKKNLNVSTTDNSFDIKNVSILSKSTMESLSVNSKGISFSVKNGAIVSDGTIASKPIVTDPGNINGGIVMPGKGENGGGGSSGGGNINIPQDKEPIKTVPAPIPYSLADGQNQDYVVMYSEENGIKKIIPQSYYDDLSKQVVCNTGVAGNVGVMYNEKKFVDTENHWANKAIKYMAARNVVNGIDNDNFAPNVYVSRADFVTMLMRMLNLSASDGDGFLDVDDNAYYASSIKTAKALGFISGYGTEFKPLDNIKREDMFVIIDRVMKKLDMYKETKFNDEYFKDMDEVSKYAGDSIVNLLIEGIIKGNDNMVNPKQTATRAEVVTMLYHIQKR